MSALRDEGYNGDVTAGDGLYSQSLGVWETFVGPRALRFKAERGPIAGKYHATAVDIAPFPIVGDAPSGPPPAITSITPSNALPGTQVTLTGTGFDPIAQNNYVLFGNTPAYIVSANGGTELTVVVPDLPPGSVSLTVTSFAQTSSVAAFTVASSEVSLSVMLTSTNTVVVYWPSPSTGWNLEQNTDLNTTSWESPPETINDDGTTKSIVVAPPTSKRFFRLQKP